MNIGHTRNLRQVVMPPFYQNMLETWVNNGGGARNTPKTFVDIRNQIIWGNKFIKRNSQCLLFKHWINDGIIYVNDLLNQDGDIDANIVLGKLSSRRNWISELHTLKSSIPNEWKTCLKSIDYLGCWPEGRLLPPP